MHEKDYNFVMFKLWPIRNIHIELVVEQYYSISFESSIKKNYTIQLLKYFKNSIQLHVISKVEHFFRY